MSFKLEQLDMQYETLAAKLSVVGRQQLLWQTSADTGLWDVQSLLSDDDRQVLECRDCKATLLELANLVTLDPTTGLTRAVFWREYDAGSDTELRRGLDILAEIVERNPITGLPRRWVNAHAAKPSLVGVAKTVPYPHFWAELSWNTQVLIPNYLTMYSQLKTWLLDYPLDVTLKELTRIVEFCIATDLDVVVQPRHMLALLKEQQSLQAAGHSLRHALAMQYAVVTGNHASTWRARQLTALENFHLSPLQTCIGLLSQTEDDVSRLEIILDYVRKINPMAWEAVALDNLNAAEAAAGTGSTVDTALDAI